jgi:hypothetical protein
VLELLTRGRRRVVTRAVLDEIARGQALHPVLGDVAALDWLAPVPVDSLDELLAFTAHLRILGSDGRNIGESSILAWAEVHGGIALVDDQAAVNAAKLRHVPTRRSLALLCDGIRTEVLTIAQARSLVDELVAVGAVAVRRCRLRGLAASEWLAFVTASRR